MEAGRELDELIAEKVMGLHRYERRNEDDFACRICGKSENSGHPDFPHFSTDIAAAWLVMEKLDESVWLGKWGGGWCIWDTTYPDGSPMATSTGDTAPLAICLAALKALA